MSSRSYVGTAKRSFKQAIVHLLETGYRFVGSGRIARMLAEDIEELVNQFYPPPQRISSGWMVFTGTKATGGKAYPGQPVSEHELVTLAWPVCLTLADLSVMLGISTVQASQFLKKARQETGKSLLTMGYYFDQGMRPTHKGDIVQLYEQGLDEAEIARHTNHAQSSVGRYLRDYERVKLSLQRNIPATIIAEVTGLQPGVVKAYLKLTAKYHPNLPVDSEMSPQGT